ncbi:retroviral-like aspartic protease [Candidatus Microgenomates bacterium]|nr:MAG: retroviral-like aspartic protease [Candidatus Microgenomates bacterium]
MKHKYTYIEDETLPGRFVYLPIIDVNIGEHRSPVRCLIDSGSPVSIIHSPLAVVAGFIPIEGKKSFVSGIGGKRIKGYYHQIPFWIDTIPITIPVFITADVTTPYNILGQTGFFQKFTITFRLSKLEFEIQPVKQI